MDLLAIDAEGYLYAIELKRDRTPRDVVAQVLDYGSWITDLGHEEIGELFSTHHKGARLEEVFEDRFGGTLPEALNAAHHLVIVASELDNSTERIVRYLTEQFSVPVSVLFFRYYRDGDREYLARTWLNAPSEADATAAKPGKAGKAAKEPWNGQDFYVAVGEDEHRTWADQLKYGYISAGGGKKYTSPLGQLFPGARVFASSHKSATEYAVRVQWIKTLPKDGAIREKGLFANQTAPASCAMRLHSNASPSGSGS